LYIHITICVLPTLPIRHASTSPLYPLSLHDALPISLTDFARADLLGAGLDLLGRGLHFRVVGRGGRQGQSEDERTGGHSGHRSRSEEHTSETPVTFRSRMPSSA